MLIFLTLCLGLASTVVHCAHLPDYIKACSKSDPNFTKCATESARNAITRILEGDKKFATLSVKPLILPSLEITSGDFNIAFKDFEIRGLENIDIKKLDFDFKENKVKFKAYVKELEYVGKYTVGGKILVLPIQGEGNCDIKFIGGDYDFDMNLEYYKKGGVEYVKMTENKVSFTLQKVNIQFDNLFNGDKALGDNMNKILNENWQNVIDDLREAIEQPMSKIAITVANSYFSKVPAQEVFPE